MTQETASTLKMAAIQTASAPGDVSANIAHGTALVEEAAAQGARLVVLRRADLGKMWLTSARSGLPLARSCSSEGL